MPCLKEERGDLLYVMFYAQHRGLSFEEDRGSWGVVRTRTVHHSTSMYELPRHKKKKFLYSTGTAALRGDKTTTRTRRSALSPPEPGVTPIKLESPSRDSWFSVLAFLQALCSLVDSIQGY